MTQEQANKDLLTTFFQDFSRGDADAVLNALADDATWWSAGRIEGMSGTASKEAFGKGLPGLFGACKGGAITLTPTAMTAEGDRVAVEATSSADLLNGREYRNEYHFLFVLRNGKITQVKEYMDTEHARQTFLD